MDMSTPKLSSATGVDDAAVSHAPALKSMYIYEAPVRLWHWVNALTIVVLAVSGYLIGSPPPSLPGEASDNFLFGYIRFVHFTAGYILAIGFLVRIYWAIVGNDHARELFSVPILTGPYWRELFSMLKWYAFLRPYPNRYVGHNPLARLFMFLGFIVVGTFMMITGFALYGEGAQAGHWAHTLFTGWVIPLFGQSQAVHTWHHLGMWLIVLFVIVHVYAAIREDIMGRQSMLSTMISGYRMFKQ
jgi:Ni/Fe-hydrogenase 1 B-type cytochrome subunit